MLGPRVEEVLSTGVAELAGPEPGAVGAILVIEGGACLGVKPAKGKQISKPERDKSR